MNGLIMNYKSYFKAEHGFIALCFFEKDSNGATLTFSLCAPFSTQALPVFVNGEKATATYYYTKEVWIDDKQIYFNCFTLNFNTAQIEKGLKISFEEGLSLATFSAFPTDYKSCSFYCFDDKILYTQGACLYIAPKTKALLRERKKAYKKAIRQLFKVDRANVIKMLIVRIGRKLLKPFYSKKEIWIFGDRTDVAGDNGQALFECTVKNPPKNVTPYFAISKSSPDYKKMKKIGKVISPRSFRYKILFSYASCIIVSQFAYEIVYPIGALNYLKDILNKQKLVFLQHGVTINDVSSVYNRFLRKIDLFITATNQEYSSIIDNVKYGYGENVVKLTGFARFDKLTSHPEKLIFIAPSWRKSCIKDLGTMTPVDNFEKSRFFEFYNALLHNSDLIKKAKKTGFRLAFYPHYLMHKTREFFGSLDPVFIDCSNYTYNDIFKKGALLFTDYSSTQFDFAYLKKPVIYCQFDKNEFFSAHTVMPGYFEYERDGFGEVCYDLETAVSLLCEYMDRSCQLKDEYNKRIENTFVFTDKNNCKRILDEIIKKNHGKN